MPRKISSPSSDSLNLELEEIALEHPLSIDKRRGSTLDVPSLAKRGVKNAAATPKSPSPLFEVMSPMSQIVESGKKCKRKGRNSVSPVSQRQVDQSSSELKKAVGNGNDISRILEPGKGLLLVDFAEELLSMSSPQKAHTVTSSTKTPLSPKLAHSVGTMSSATRARVPSSFSSSCSSASPSCSSARVSCAAGSSSSSHSSRTSRAPTRSSLRVSSSSPSSSFSINQSNVSCSSISNSARFLPRPPSSLPSDASSSRLRRTLPRKKVVNLLSDHLSPSTTLASKPPSVCKAIQISTGQLSNSLPESNGNNQEVQKVRKSPRLTKNPHPPKAVDMSMSFSMFSPSSLTSTVRLRPSTSFPPPALSSVPSSFAKSRSTPVLVSSPSSPVCANITLPPRRANASRSRYLNVSCGSNSSLDVTSAITATRNNENLDDSFDKLTNHSIDQKVLSTKKAAKIKLIAATRLDVSHDLADWTLPITPTNASEQVMISSSRGSFSSATSAAQSSAFSSIPSKLSSCSTSSISPTFSSSSAPSSNPCLASPSIVLSSMASCSMGSSGSKSASCKPSASCKSLYPSVVQPSSSSTHSLKSQPYSSKPLMSSSASSITLPIPTSFMFCSSSSSVILPATPAAFALSPIVNESNKSLGGDGGSLYPVPTFSPSPSRIVSITGAYEGGDFEPSVSLRAVSGSTANSRSFHSKGSEGRPAASSPSTGTKQKNHTKSSSRTPSLRAGSITMLTDDSSSSSSSESLSDSDSESDACDGVSTTQFDDVSFEWFPIASAVTKCAKPRKKSEPAVFLPTASSSVVSGSSAAAVVSSTSGISPLPKSRNASRNNHDHHVKRIQPATIVEEEKVSGEPSETPIKSVCKSIASSRPVQELSDDQDDDVLIDEEEYDDTKMQDGNNGNFNGHALLPTFPFFPIPSMTVSSSDDAPKNLRYQISVQVRNVPRGKTKPNPRVAVFESIGKQSVKLTETQCVKATTDPVFTEPIVLSQAVGKLLLFRLYDVQKSGTETTLASAVILMDRLLAADGPMSSAMSLISGAKEIGPELVLQILSTTNTLTQPLNWFYEVKVPSSQALERMAQGFVVTLHVDKKKPKKLYMRWKEGSHDGGLYWAQPGFQKMSGNLPITEILTVLRGKHTAGLRQDSAFRTLEQQCISIVCPSRTLELSFETRTDCDVVSSGLLALIHRLSPHRRELFLRGRHLPTAHCAVVIFDSSRDQRMKLAETEGQSGANPIFSRSVVLSCCDRALSLCVYAKESLKSDRLGNLIGSVKVNMAELAALETAPSSSFDEYYAKRSTGRELSFELVLEGKQPQTPLAPLLVVRVAPELQTISLHQGPVNTDECLELMRKGQQFTKFGYLTGKAASRFLFYESGEMGGMLFWCNGPERVLDLDHSIRISTIVDVRVGNGSTPTFTKDEARNAREDLSFSILTTSRSVDLETPFTHVRNAFVHGLRHLLSLSASELINGSTLSKGTLFKRTLLTTLKTLPKATAANRKFSL